jgi:hypothetical protein
MSKILKNGCEGNGESLRTAPFKCVENIEEYILFLNEIYSGSEDLLSLQPLGDEVILHASTYMLSGEFEDEDNADAEIASALEGTNAPDDLKQKLIDWGGGCDLTVGEIVELLIAPGQSVNVQITDPLENSEFTIEK